jgi:hypothetical protein
MWTSIGRGVLVLSLAMPGICSAQKAPKRSPANFSITAVDTNDATGDVYNVTGTFLTASRLQPGVKITSWNISVGPYSFSNLESPLSNASVFRAVSNSTTITADTYPDFAKGNCGGEPDNLRIQFFNYLTGYFFTAYVPVGKLTAPGTQADLIVTSNCLFAGGVEFYSARRSGLASLNADHPGWDHSDYYLQARTCMLYESGTIECGNGNNGVLGTPGNRAEGTVVQF